MNVSLFIGEEVPTNNKLVKVGDIAYLECPITTTNTVAVEWKHDDKRILLHDINIKLEQRMGVYKSKFRKDTNSVWLEIQINSDVYLGHYLCLKYSQTGLPAKSKWNVIVQDQLEDSIGGDVTAFLGEDVTLECSSKRIVIVSAYWMHEDEVILPINGDGKTRYIAREAKDNFTSGMEILDVSLEDAGNYSCLLLLQNGDYLYTEWNLHIQGIYSQ
ncbi:Titin-like [Holothuria leucospilota]|uniref:Titin-like n=1 Tax=Holothuria leucospilota TaxID=206669 RepID=A0A9Q1HHN7_HOLLE|nr:Titin-like [Holothuria leucospilota]